MTYDSKFALLQFTEQMAEGAGLLQQPGGKEAAGCEGPVAAGEQQG
jgi:hypothetical protein